MHTQPIQTNSVMQTNTELNLKPSEKSCLDSIAVKIAIIAAAVLISAALLFINPISLGITLSAVVIAVGLGLTVVPYCYVVGSSSIPLPSSPLPSMPLLPRRTVAAWSTQGVARPLYPASIAQQRVHWGSREVTERYRSRRLPVSRTASPAPPPPRMGFGNGAFHHHPTLRTSHLRHSVEQREPVGRR